MEPLASILALKFSHNGKDVRATFLADGSKIIFASDRDGTMNIYSMETNGSNVTQLTCNQANSLAPYVGTIQAVAP